MTADLLLLLTAAIWGFAFVAQRAGMAFMGPFTFNAVRFLIGGLAVFGLYKIFPKKLRETDREKAFSRRELFLGGGITGVVLFIGASLQQIGLVGTSAGTAGFITGLYVVLVPILGLVIGKRTSLLNWLGAAFAVIGLYFLSVKAGSAISVYDLIVLLGALVWAVHVHLIAHFSIKFGALKLAIFQSIICGVLSLLAAFIFEVPTLEGLRDGWLPLLYGSILSVGLAYTLQVVAQRKADPSHAAIILSLESVFAALGGWFILGENMGFRGVVGAAIIFAGMLISQLQKSKLDSKHVY